MGSTLKCAVCSRSKSNCSTDLDIPICPKCWKDPQNSSFFEAEINKITPKIFLGNEQAQKRKWILKALGVTNILVVGYGLQCFHKDDFIYKRIDVQDFVSENIGRYFDETYDFIEEAKGNVFVHCLAGISRSPSVVIAYLMRKDGKSFEEARNFVQERRIFANPNQGFVTQLMGYEAQLKKSRRI